MQAEITITPAARAYIAEVLQKQPGMKLRISIKKSGCSGYAYQPALVATEEATDRCCDIDKELQIYLDTAWWHLLQYLHIDYIIDATSGLKQKRLVFSNPNEAGRCGCGESFHIE